MSASKLATIFSALSFSALAACQPVPTGPTAAERIAIAKAEQAAAEAKIKAAQAQSQIPQYPATIAEAPPPLSNGQKCAKGMGNTIKVGAIATGVGCVVDLFISGGAICATVLASAPATVPMALGTGCALGVVNGPESGSYAGTPQGSSSQSKARAVGTNPPPADPNAVPAPY